MELVIVLGGSVGVILMTLGIDVGVEVFREWSDNREALKARETVEDQALKTLTVAFRLKTAATQHHRPHGNHRRIPVS